MSALAVSHYPSTTSLPSSELGVTQEISRLASAARRYDEALHAIFSVVLAVPGVWKISIEAPPELAEWLTLDRASKRPKGQWGSAIARLEAGLHRWGQVRICFELPCEISGGPLRFARYLAQQIAALLDRTALRDQRALLQQQIVALTRRLETRKAVARAIGLIARRDHLSPEAALERIAAVARRHRRSVLLTAQSIIFLEGEGGNLRSPTFRRLLPNETTGSYSRNKSYGAQP